MKKEKINNQQIPEKIRKKANLIGREHGQIESSKNYDRLTKIFKYLGRKNFV
jgi:hypothetical protein